MTRIYPDPKEYIFKIVYFCLDIWEVEEGLNIQQHVSFVHVDWTRQCEVLQVQGLDLWK